MNQGLTIGMAYYISYCSIYAARILSTDFNNLTAFMELEPSETTIFISTKLMIHIQPLLETSLMTFREDAVNFYSKIQIIVWAISDSFIIIFAIVYLLILLRLLNRLKIEIWLTHEMINMIPSFIIKSNPSVQNQILKIRKHIK